MFAGGTIGRRTLTRPLRAFVMIVAVLACKQIPYGNFMAEGSEAETDLIRVKVPGDRWRVSVDYPSAGDVLMYEDFGPGLPRGAVLLAQSRSGGLGEDVIAELQAFGGPLEPLFDIAEVKRAVVSRDGSVIEYAITIPPDQKTSANTTIIRRQQAMLYGVLLDVDSRVFRIEVAWNPSHPSDLELTQHEATRHHALLAEALGAICLRSDHDGCSPVRRWVKAPASGPLEE